MSPAGVFGEIGGWSRVLARIACPRTSNSRPAVEGDIMTENQLPSPALVQRHLHGMHYPASKEDLVNYARSQCSDSNHPDSECERVVQALNRLPDQQYQRPTDVSKAFGELARNYLQQASYPANRDDLVATARDQGADDIVVDTIIVVPDRDYEDADAVIVEIEAAV
ncbi:MAG TPA: DUF2795 domain-containing protein [Streptosporangiaceae bacterium]|jgi:hypothetical protein